VAQTTRDLRREKKGPYQTWGNLTRNKQRYEGAGCMELKAFKSRRGGGKSFKGAGALAVRAFARQGKKMHEWRARRTGNEKRT